MYIRSKGIGNHKYYYLVQGKTNGDGVLKQEHLAYLGKEPTIPGAITDAQTKLGRYVSERAEHLKLLRSDQYIPQDQKNKMFKRIAICDNQIEKLSNRIIKLRGYEKLAVS